MKGLYLTFGRHLVTFRVKNGLKYSKSAILVQKNTKNHQK